MPTSDAIAFWRGHEDIVRGDIQEDIADIAELCFHLHSSQTAFVPSFFLIVQICSDVH